MNNNTVPAAQARAGLSALLERVQAGERVVITRSGTPVAALVSLEDWRLLETLRELEALTAPLREAE